MKNGQGALNIAGLNTDSVKEKESQQSIISELTKRKIHIAIIQGTRISKGLKYLTCGYRTITLSAGKTKKPES